MLKNDNSSTTLDLNVQMQCGSSNIEAISMLARILSFSIAVFLIAVGFIHIFINSLNQWCVGFGNDCIGPYLTWCTGDFLCLENQNGWGRFFSLDPNTLFPLFGPLFFGILLFSNCREKRRG